MVRLVRTVCLPEYGTQENPQLLTSTPTAPIYGLFCASGRQCLSRTALTKWREWKTVTDFTGAIFCALLTATAAQSSIVLQAVPNTRPFQVKPTNSSLQSWGLEGVR